MNRALVENDFTEERMDGVLHGWKYENHRYKVHIDMCWDGCDIKVTFKNPGNDGTTHVGRGEPSFHDQDVIAALAIGNALLAEQQYGMKHDKP